VKVQNPTWNAIDRNFLATARSMTWKGQTPGPERSADPPFADHLSEPLKLFFDGPT
jgi:hypothetical protein